MCDQDTYSSDQGLSWDNSSGTNASCGGRSYHDTSDTKDSLSSDINALTSFSWIMDSAAASQNVGSTSTLLMSIAQEGNTADLAIRSLETVSKDNDVVVLHASGSFIFSAEVLFVVVRSGDNGLVGFGVLPRFGAVFNNPLDYIVWYGITTVSQRIAIDSDLNAMIRIFKNDPSIAKHVELCRDAFYKEFVRFDSQTEVQHV